jgi:hypothetical protein
MIEKEMKTEFKTKEIRERGRKGTKKFLAQIQEQAADEEAISNEIKSGDKDIAKVLNINTCCEDEAGAPEVDDEDAFLHALLREFPHLHLPPEVLHQMWVKASSQMEKLKHTSATGVKGDRSTKELVDARRKYALMVDMMRKEARVEEKRLAFIEERRRERQMKTRHAEKRHLKVRALPLLLLRMLLVKIEMG